MQPCRVNERTLTCCASPARPPERLPGDGGASACCAGVRGAAGGSDGGDKKRDRTHRRGLKWSIDRIMVSQHAFGQNDTMVISNKGSN
ncbi:hypothetical protein DAI22_06g243803 [Oryza sativa Japonica Group]|nr:hypothetical protein DAI22_06g243803 [Oryza sativa Japonica Group]